jgi:hypothetical protein
MTENDNSKSTPATAPSPSRDDKTLKVPDGDVLLRRVAGPDGVHPTFGHVKHGRLYTVEFPLAVRLTTEVGAEFETVYADDRQRIQTTVNKDKEAKDKQEAAGRN